MAAHLRWPFWSSATPVWKLPLYLFERALPMFWLPLVSAKNMPRLIRAGDVGVCRIEALGPRNGGPEIDDVLERRRRILRIGGRRLHDAEELDVLVDQRLVVGIEIAPAGLPNLLGLPILDGSASVRSL